MTVPRQKLRVNEIMRRCLGMGFSNLALVLNHIHKRKAMDGVKVRRLLVIDDDLEECLIFKEALQQVDATISFHCIQESVKAVSVAKEFQPDVIFTDLNMPTNNGLDCVRMVKEHFPELPVVIYSGSEDEKLISKAYEHGAELVFQKPPSFMQLVNGLQVLLSIDWKDKELMKNQFYGKVVDLSAFGPQQRTV